MGVGMPVMGGESSYVTSSLFAADCKVARFAASSSNDDKFSMTSALNCDSGRGGGRGIVCRR